jgi:hypothetical protein
MANKKRNIKRKTSYIEVVSSLAEVEVSYEIVNGKRVNKIVETGNTKSITKIN